ncbi:MAG: hypothetical protein QMD14_01980 [Candidatus Aenigmarchaeota archaeon]|nr:hypothetical protein [Candidatus Aenigmarchaeota archaeon]
MPITYPLSPTILEMFIPKRLVLHFGEGLNCPPPEADIYCGFDARTGTATLGYYKTIAMFGRLGFEAIKIEESIAVSPVFREYYELTVRQKDHMEAELKTHLASIATAISDLELVKHDLRRYREFMDYYAMIDEGEKLIKKGKVEEGKELILKGQQSLKAVFIDLVDVHTGEGIAIKLIAPRWPTIIADFMRLEDEDVLPEKIKEKYKVPEAEAIILATKNKIYLEWRDRLFKVTVEERFGRLVELVEMRKKSIEEYKDMVRPLVRRYKMLTDALEKPPGKLIERWTWRPDAQRVSLDSVRIWAWKPFAPTEKYRVTVESLRAIRPCGVAPPIDIGTGFWPEEIEEIKRELREKRSLSYAEELLLRDNLMDALPAEPSIDPVVRRYIEDIEKFYGVKITPMDLFNARQKLVDKFKEAIKGHGPQLWYFSPYFIFFEIPVDRFHSILPAAPIETGMESLYVDRFTAATQTQNMIILHYLELIAREKQVENFLRQMLGELGVTGESIEDLKKKLVFRVEEIKPKKEVNVKKPRYTLLERIIKPFHDFFWWFGIEIPMLAIGKYEFSLAHRITKFYQPQVAAAHEDIKNIFKYRFKVPGAVMPI